MSNLHYYTTSALAACSFVASGVFAAAPYFTILAPVAALNIGLPLIFGFPLLVTLGLVGALVSIAVFAFSCVQLARKNNKEEVVVEKVNNEPSKSNPQNINETKPDDAQKQDATVKTDSDSKSTNIGAQSKESDGEEKNEEVVVEKVNGEEENEEVVVEKVNNEQNQSSSQNINETKENDAQKQDATVKTDSDSKSTNIGAQSNKKQENLNIVTDTQSSTSQNEPKKQLEDTGKGLFDQGKDLLKKFIPVLGAIGCFTAVYYCYVNNALSIYNDNSGNNVNDTYKNFTDTFITSSNTDTCLITSSNTNMSGIRY